DRVEEIQVPYLSNKEMWNVLKQYKVVKKTETPKTETKSETNRDFIEFK
ncbi:FtsK/SpoIIIE domain-containing protein, partial [Bacillus mycoides]